MVDFENYRLPKLSTIRWRNKYGEVIKPKPYEIQMIKDTPTGMRYLVRHNTYGKYIICSSVSETGNSISNPETTGQYDYVMKKWQKIDGKYVPTR